MDRNMLKIHESEGIGEVNISDEVIAIIAGFAAAEVDGVAGMVGGFGKDIVELLGKKNFSKGIDVNIVDDIVSIELNLIVDYQVSIVDVTAQVQEKVKTAIENMTGLKVNEVNIRVSGVNTK